MRTCIRRPAKRQRDSWPSQRCDRAQEGSRLPEAQEGWFGLACSKPRISPDATLADRLVGVFRGCLKHHTVYDESQAWHSDKEQLGVAA